VRVRELPVSLRTLRIVLFRDSDDMRTANLVISANPVWMRGPFEWSNAALQVEAVTAATTAAAPFTSQHELSAVRPDWFRVAGGIS
jgi:hypothetical protein